MARQRQRRSKNEGIAEDKNSCAETGIKTVAGKMAIIAISHYVADVPF